MVWMWICEGVSVCECMYSVDVCVRVVWVRLCTCEGVYTYGTDVTV